MSVILKPSLANVSGPATATQTQKKAYIIGPGRYPTQRQRHEIGHFVAQLEVAGWKVYWSCRDTCEANDPYDICQRHKEVVEQADVIFLYRAINTEMSLFDLGMAFMADKPLVFINPKASDVVGATKSDQALAMLRTWMEKTHGGVTTIAED